MADNVVTIVVSRGGSHDGQVWPMPEPTVVGSKMLFGSAMRPPEELYVITDETSPTDRGMAHVAVPAD